MKRMPLKEAVLKPLGASVESAALGIDAGGAEAYQPPPHGNDLAEVCVSGEPHDRLCRGGAML